MDPLEDAVLVLARYKSREVTQIWTHKIGKEEKKAMFFKYQLIALFIYLIKHTLKYVSLIH